MCCVLCVVGMISSDDVIISALARPVWYPLSTGYHRKLILLVSSFINIYNIYVYVPTTTQTIVYTTRRADRASVQPHVAQAEDARDPRHTEEAGIHHRERDSRK